MLAISQFVVTRAMADWLAFAEARLPIELSINVPLRAFRDARFLRFLHNRLPIHPRFPGLVVEIDAAELAAERDTICALAAELAMFRVRLSVDDLGCCTFWSGLPVFPFGELKVGQQFVSGCARERVKRALCQTIVDIGHRSGAMVVAKGVDAQEDLVAVRDMGFDMVQGFLLGTPLEPAAFTRAMQHRAFALH
jgi:EAL domain-containing protein (putative c-di-GMP-specific phosphodiesterase class I)